MATSVSSGGSMKLSSWRMTMTNCVRVFRDGFNWYRARDIQTGQWSGPWRRGG